MNYLYLYIMEEGSLIRTVKETDITGIKFNYSRDKSNNDNSILVNAINKIGDGIEELERDRTGKES